MKRIVLAALAALTLASPALAQGYFEIPPRGYGPPRSGYYEGRGYDRPRGYDHEHRRRWHDHDHHDDDDDRPRRRGGDWDRRRGDDGPRGARGSMCITSRGVCPIGAAVPRNTPCRCFIPGFGPKRGASN